MSGKITPDSVVKMLRIMHLEGLLPVTPQARSQWRADGSKRRSQGIGVCCDDVLPGQPVAEMPVSLQPERQEASTQWHAHAKHRSLRSIWDAPGRETADMLIAKALADYSAHVDFCDWLESNIEDTLAILELPPGHRKIQDE